MSRSRFCLVALIVLVALLLALGFAPTTATARLGSEPPGRSGGEQHYFEVNSNVDDNMAHDKNLGDCICEAWLNGCTLRAAIEEANACGGADTIAFHSSLQGTIIYLDGGQGELQILWEATTISAQSIWDSANNRPGLTLHGGMGNFHGLVFAADGCAVYGLYITAFRYVAVRIDSAYNYVGGPYVGQRNILSGNEWGVQLYGADAHHNNIQGNWIGLDATGQSANPNARGIEISKGAHDNTIGGSTAEGNVISGNTESGVYIMYANTDGNRLGGNIIGLAADGSTLLGNGWGVYVNSGPQNTTIGSPLAGNTIAGNLRDGVYIQETSSFWVQGNTISGNGENGVNICATPNGQILANTIAYNTGHGVQIQQPQATGNLIAANSIHHNGFDGIALVSGGNGELPAPTITGATPTRVEGTACAGCMVHVYSDSGAQGETYHGAVSADAGGNWVYTGTVISGPNATATNTDSSNNTSEFSAPVVVGPPCTPVSGVTITGPASGVVNVSICFTATVTPVDATPPLAYIWAPGPGSGQGTPVACYTWDTPGDKVITVTASNCGGSALDTHTVTIGGGACVPVTGVTIGGPTTGLVGVTYGFHATIAPANATAPIVYTWAPPPGGGQGSANATYTWSTAGTYNFSVAASNCGGAGTGSDNHIIVISAGAVYRIFLPVVAKR